MADRCRLAIEEIDSIIRMFHSSLDALDEGSSRIEEH